MSTTQVQKKLINTLLPWVAPAIILAVWQGVSIAGVFPPRSLPSPTKVLQTAFELLMQGEFLGHLLVSARRATFGFLIGGTAGFALGLVNGVSKTSAIVLDSSVQMIRTIPHLALIPLVILWLGIGEAAKLFLVSLGVAFPIYVNTLHGVRSVDPGLIEMGRIYGLDGIRLFRLVVLPGSLPSVLVGVRYGLGVMWLTLIVAETISAEAGIGYLAMNAREFLRTDVVMVCILLYALLGKGADSLTRLLEKRWLHWHASQQILQGRMGTRP